MSQITTPIPTQAFELVRNRIGEILIDELVNQATITYKPELNATVSIDKFVPFDKTEMPAVNVMLDRGDYDNQTTVDKDGTYRYFIDCYHKAPTTVTKDGDVEAMRKLQTLMGTCAAILESSKYITLGFVAPFVINRHVENIRIAPPADAKDSNSIVMGRINFVVRVPEEFDKLTPELIAGFDTQVKLGDTDKGYIYSGDNIPVPPITGGIVTVNDDVFGDVDPGETIDVPVQNTYSEELGSLIGGKWIIPDQQYTDTDLTVKSVPAGNPIICLPGDLQTEINAATATQLSDALEANTDVVKIAYRRPPLTGQIISYATGDDGWRLLNGIYQYDKQGKRPMLQGEDADNADGTVDDWLKLSPKTPNAFGTLFRFTDSVGAQNYDGTGGSISDYIIDNLTGLAYQWNAGFASFTVVGFTSAIAAAIAHDNGTFSDFFIPNRNEWGSIASDESAGSVLDYPPLNKIALFFMWSSTTLASNTTRAFIMQTFGNPRIISVDKAPGEHSIYVRNHFN